MGGVENGFICYKFKNLRKSTRDLIDLANIIINEYREQNLYLTLRQIFYQFVSRDLILNTNKEYKRLGIAIDAGRWGGLIDWRAIVDHTRYLRWQPHWGNPSEIIESASEQYAVDKWASQPVRCEVWIEKEALVGVFEQICQELDVGLFCCRGYTGQSSMWQSAMRLVKFTQAGQKVFIFHFGDHDPSGMDMTRDIQERLNLLSFGAPIEVRRIALNMEQIDTYNPPPNPAKISDKRAAAYITKYGSSSWEIDALPPDVLRDLVEDNVTKIRNKKKWKQEVIKEKQDKNKLKKVSKHWVAVQEFIKKKGV